MKLTTKPASLTALLLVLLPGLLFGADTALVVYEMPDGASFNRAGERTPVFTGDRLNNGDTLETGDATVILSLCDGSLVTIYPNSTVVISGLGQQTVSLQLVRGEVLGDNRVGCQMSVTTTVGETRITEGVFGVLLNQMGDQNWTLQVRNLDGTVVFVGDSRLDTSNTMVSVLEPNKEVSIPAGEEFMVRGVYNAEEQVFSLAQDGVAMAVLDTQASGHLRDGAEFMGSIQIPEDGPDGGEEPPERPNQIEIPYEDVDTASDKG